MNVPAPNRFLFWLLATLLTVPASLLTRHDAAFAADALNQPKPNQLLSDKTLVAWVYLDRTNQQGGSALTLMEGEDFDAIVFGERQAGRWMAGSDFFRRTQSAEEQRANPPETASSNTLVQVAIAYAGNRISIFRDGQPYASYAADQERPFGSNTTVLLGLRYLGQLGEIGFLSAAIEEARIYDTALSAEQIALLRPNLPSDPRPLAWWTFEAGRAEDVMKTFPATRLEGNARIADGKLVLDGRSYLWAARDAKLLTVEPEEETPFDASVQNLFYKARSKRTGNMWDTWLYFHEGTYYLYYLANARGQWDNISMAQSPDGVHWKEIGRVLSKGRGVTWMGTGSTWKSPRFETDGKFFLNFSEWTGPRQTIFFAESKDLVHWTRLGNEYEFTQDERWYERNGRWDCIWTLPRPGGGLYGYWTATPKAETGGRFGFGETTDGITWQALPPPKVSGVGEGEVGAIEKIGDKYYMMFGTGGSMATLVADRPEGPFVAARKNLRLLAGHTYFARFFPTPDGLLVNHHSIARNGQVYFGTLKATALDEDGTLRLRWWPGNEKLKHQTSEGKLSPQQAGDLPAVALLDSEFDGRNGLVLEGTLKLPESKDAKPVGLFIAEREDLGSAILVQAGGAVGFGPMRADGTGFKAEQQVDREWSFGATARFRFLLKGSLLEFYLDDLLMQCYSLPQAASGRIGLIQGGQAGAIADLKAWQCESLAAESPAGSVASPEAKLARPTPQQYAWHEQERIMFVCLDPCTWQGREYDNHSTPLSAINPTALDTEQWCRAAELWGAKEILFVAKHTGGFCWWQTETTKYGIKDAAWKGGQGDVLAELSASCRKHGLNLGVYVYPGDDTWGAPSGSGGRTKDPSKQEAYNQVFRQQLTEVLTRYGKITEVWFDGSCVIEVGDLLKQHAADAVIFQGPQATIRWPGTESGRLPYPAWNSLKRQDLQTGVATAAQGNPDGDAWAPLEADTTLYDHNWFWAAENEKKRKRLEDLMDIYYKSAGRGGVLLLNSTPNTNGLIPDGDLRLYAAFGQEIDRRFSRPIAEIKNQHGANVELVLPRPTLINHGVIMEDYREGERIREYILEGLSDGQWKQLSQGTSVGRKKIDRFRAVQVSRVRLRVTRFAAEPILRSLAVFQVEGAAAGSLTTGRSTTASAFHSAPYVAAMATDDDPQTRWGCPDGTTTCWLEVDLGAPTAFGRVAISELADRIRRFTLEYRDATNAPWQTACAGNLVGAAFQQDFPIVTGRFVRLNINEASGPPTIWEFNLHPGVPGWQRCGEWTAESFRDGKATLTLDLSPFITEPGQFEVKFEQTSGRHPLRILSATLFYEGEEATPGLLRRLDAAQSFNVNRTAQVTKETSSVLKVEITAVGGNDCHGKVWIRSQSGR